MESRLKKDLVRVDIPDSCNDLLAQQQGLQRAFVTANQALEEVGGEGRGERLDAQAGEPWHLLQFPLRDQVHVPEPAHIGEAQLLAGTGSLSEGEHDARVLVPRPGDGNDLQIPCHSQVDDEREAMVQSEQEILAHPAHFSDAAAAKPDRKNGGIRRSDGWGGEGLDARNASSDEAPPQLPRDGLDIGELRQPQATAV
jgi:hypothetical protein